MGMGVLLLLILATIMATFGILGYQKGSTWALVALPILLVAFVAVERSPGVIIRYMNGLYIGVLLVFRSGLNDIAGGDLESAAQKLAGIKKPFQGPTEGLALLIVMLIAVALGLILTRVIKSKQGMLGGALGLIYGYLLSASFLPSFLGFSNTVLPVPIIRPGKLMLVGGGGGGAAAGGASAITDFLRSLTQPEGLQMLAIIIAISIALFVVLSVRLASKKG